ncbi:MAG: single-stranded DNA-binding protein [Desulfobacteraceae bacterium]|jgi:single-strand selective monofunctional uracil DNA glycosylase
MRLNEAKKQIEAVWQALAGLQFKSPVVSVYNPLEYARKAYDNYWRRYAGSPREIVLLGMNPGPWGMVQTGIPFGDVQMVRHWLEIDTPVQVPAKQHPKRPVQGLDCPRSEVSGRRLWGWAKERFQTPDRFFERFWVANYCPLAFMESSGRNRTPDKLPKAEKQPLFEICDQALRLTIEAMQPNYVIGIGSFAAQRAKAALKGMNLRLGQITHPSPANPRANRGWASYIEAELEAMGISLATPV